MMQKILVTGALGQLGKAFALCLNTEAIFLTRAELDLANLDSITSILDCYQFDVLINTAAYTLVDLAESQEELTQTINAKAVEVLALYCKKHDKIFIHYSTDYVFDGTKKSPWHEEDNTNAISVYGKSKLEGEKNIVKHSGKYIIFRTSWVYDDQGKNFLNTMLQLANKGNALSIVSDQHGAPTYAYDLAEASIKALKQAVTFPIFPSGIYHLVNSGSTSWYEFAKEIFILSHSSMQNNLIAVTSESYPSFAKRPLNSRLSCKKIKDIFNITMPSWQDGLKRCLDKRFK
jgi:dTDP-4-dehydrorhamnose reductase